MTDPSDYFGNVNRKCATCGKLILGAAYSEVETDDGTAETCSEWCAERYRSRE
jgi:hypothetical protein